MHKKARHHAVILMEILSILVQIGLEGEGGKLRAV